MIQREVLIAVMEGIMELARSSLFHFLSDIIVL